MEPGYKAFEYDGITTQDKVCYIMGALEYELYPICIYSVVREDMPESFGKLYLAAINRFGPMPQYEMEEIRAFTELPEAVTYPLFYPAFLERVNAFINLNLQWH